MILKNKRILVTGGAGFIGSHLVDALAKDNFVLVVDDMSSDVKKHYLFHSHAKLVVYDIRTIHDGWYYNHQFDIYFHLAARNLRASIGDPEVVFDVNARGTLNMCKAAMANKVKRFIYVSSSEVYGTNKFKIVFPSKGAIYMNEYHVLEPTTVYGASKLAGEAIVRAYHRTYGLPAMIIRPFNVYGERSHIEGDSGEVIPRFVIRALQGKSLTIYGDGEQTRDFTHVSDTVRGIIQAAECDAMVGETVNIGSGKDRKIKYLASLINSMTGNNGITYLEQGRPGDVMHHKADISKARNMFDYRPKVKLKEGLRRYIDWVSSLASVLVQNIEVKEKNW